MVDPPPGIPYSMQASGYTGTKKLHQCGQAGRLWVCM